MILKYVFKLRVSSLRSFSCSYGVHQTITANQQELNTLLPLFKSPDKAQLLKTVNEENQHELLDSSVRQFDHIDYSVRTRLKELLINKSFYEIAKTLEYDEKLSQNVREHLERFDYEKLFAIENRIVPIKNIDGCIARIGLTIARGLDGQLKTVGRDPFSKKEKNQLFSKNEEQSAYVIPITNSKLYNERDKLIASHLQQFVRLNDLPAFDSSLKNWLGAQIRKTPNDDQIMLIIRFHTRKLKKEILKSVFEQTNDYFFNGPGKECKLDSLYYHILDYSTKVNYEHISGLKCLIHDQYSFYPSAEFPKKFEAFETFNKQIENLMQTHFSDIDVVITFNCNSTFILTVAHRIGKKIVVVESTRGKVDVMAEVCKEKGITENINFHNSLKRLPFVISNAIRNYGENIKIGFVYRDFSDDLHEFEKLALKYTLTEIRCKQQVKKIIFCSYNVISSSFQNSFYNLFCGERKSENISGAPFLPEYSQPIDRTTGTYVAMYLQRE